MGDLCKPRPKIEPYKQSLLYQGPILWNSLSNDLNVAMISCLLNNRTHRNYNDYAFHNLFISDLMFVLIGRQGRITWCNWQPSINVL